MFKNLSNNILLICIVIIVTIVILILYCSFRPSTSSVTSAPSVTSATSASSTSTSTSTPSTPSTSSTSSVPSTSSTSSALSVPSTSSVTTINPLLLENKCELFTNCYFKTILDFTNIKDSFTNIRNIIELDNTYIRSIRSNGVIVTLYSNPDYTGEKMILRNNILNIECLHTPMRSIKIEPIPK